MTTVATGMTAQQVRQLLGKPSHSVDDNEYLALYSSRRRLGFLRRRRKNRSEAWVYADTPQVGLATWIHFAAGRVEKVVVGPLTADGRRGPSDED
ncbi:outer membrane protein assembly factor BamE [Streptomyces sp. SBST2-5]|uniref:Outer membrane protein assembly factor BamE n=1 Tax=Streptomyces composti TaxID=2720025 RepID=A0ABX1ACY0_9ACTN|nr:outer membrane protein assembly factor BamE [Streptomyces composti]NJP53097.1 outer membrane protein assembly factor BamE [Streptomyces composti]